MTQVWDFQLVLLGSLRSFFELWMEVGIRGKFMKKVEGFVFYAVVWSIWKVRNDQIFRGETVHLERILSLIKFKMGCWI